MYQPKIVSTIFAFILWIVTQSSVAQGESAFRDWVKRAETIQALVKPEEVVLRSATKAQLDSLASYLPVCLTLTDAQIQGLFSPVAASIGRKKRSLNDLKRYFDLLMADTTNDNFEKRDNTAEINKLTSEISTFLGRLNPALLHEFSVGITAAEHDGGAAEKLFVQQIVIGASLCSSVKGSRRDESDNNIVKAIQHLQKTLYVKREIFQSGLYPAFKHAYTFGPIDQIYEREVPCEFDNSFFFTVWIVVNLLEAYEIIRDDGMHIRANITDDYIKNSVQTLVHYFHDSSHGPTVPLFNYYMIATGKVPYRTPADFDDSSLALLLYSKLEQFKDDFPQSFSLISKFEPEKLIPLFVQYSYQPYSADLNHSMIDTRTYFWVRHFISDYLEEQNIDDPQEDSVMLMTTWVVNHGKHFHEQGRKLKQFGFPNHIDVAVITNCLHAILQTIVNHPQTYKQWTDTKLLRLLKDSANLVKWAINTGWIRKRTDLVMIYYPSMNVFYWLLSRLTHFLDNTDFSYWHNNDSQVYGIIAYLRHIFTEVMRKTFTPKVIESVKQDGEWMFFDDYLGYYDDTNYYEDRLATTSVIVDMLINTWAKRGSTDQYSLEWINETPEQVIGIVKHGSTFVNDHITRENYPKEQAFFSASFGRTFAKRTQYPRTYFCYINETCPASKDTVVDLDMFHFLFSVVGVHRPIDSEEYSHLLSEQENFDEIPEYINHWNSSALLYFSSPSNTYSQGILAMLKARIVLNRHGHEEMYSMLMEHGSNHCSGDDDDTRAAGNKVEDQKKHESNPIPTIASVLSVFDLKCDRKKGCYYKDHYFSLN